jgi:hypothetical protein
MDDMGERIQTRRKVIRKHRKKRPVHHSESERIPLWPERFVDETADGLIDRSPGKRDRDKLVVRTIQHIVIGDSVDNDVGVL